MQPVTRALKSISFLRSKPIQLSPSFSTTSISRRELVDEELGPGYNPNHYYPATPGEVLANRYQLLVKIGWGTASTVWLAKDVGRYIMLLFTFQSNS